MIDKLLTFLILCYNIKDLLEDTMRQFKIGFTLMEVLLALAIIGIIATIMTPMLVNNLRQYLVVSKNKLYLEIIILFKWQI